MSRSSDDKVTARAESSGVACSYDTNLGNVPMCVNVTALVCTQDPSDPLMVQSGQLVHSFVEMAR